MILVSICTTPVIPRLALSEWIIVGSEGDGFTITLHGMKKVVSLVPTISSSYGIPTAQSDAFLLGKRWDLAMQRFVARRNMPRLATSSDVQSDKTRLSNTS